MYARNLIAFTISSFLALSARELLPRLRPVFLRPSNCFCTHSMSLRRSSVWMISMSRIGSTSPSTWMTSASSNARTTWKMPSTARTCERNAFPRPAPVDAPFDSISPPVLMTLRDETTHSGEAGDIDAGQVCGNAGGRFVELA